MLNNRTQCQIYQLIKDLNIWKLNLDQALVSIFIFLKRKIISINKRGLKNV